MNAVRLLIGVFVSLTEGVREKSVVLGIYEGKFEEANLRMRQALAQERRIAWGVSFPTASYPNTNG
jgi:hypothetical protein